MPPTNGSPSFQSTSTSAPSTLRPRTRRLISIDDELNPPSARASDSDRASPYGSRAPSPSPGGTGSPSRAGLEAQPATSFARSASAQAARGSNVLSGLWGNSWSAIQGLATNVLGNDAHAHAHASAAPRRRKPLLAAHRRTSSSVPPKQWGPSSSSAAHVGAGTHEEQESLVRAMKRRDLLTASEHLVPDSVGRIKRRNSDERLSSSAPPSENEDRDALVYIHNVRPQDTLAGISIRFNCQPAILRKANRMWPNDSVQTKQTLVIPVDACGVKGRPVAAPNVHQEEDLLLGEWGDGAETSPLVDTYSLPNGWHTSKAPENDTTSVISSSLSTTDSDPPWKHDSWVLFLNEKEPTEIGRMPRRALGFFPPARRKSLVYSDTSTPRASLDAPRASTTSSPTQSVAARPRASSNLSTVSASAAHPRHRNSSAFHLHGPGGVGTMGKNVRSPGPAQDGLNKLFAQHLPSVEPPPEQEYFTPWAPSLLAADSAVASSQHGSGTTPLGGPDLSLQEIGGAIEGWVRKVGGQASKLLSEPSTPGQGRRSAVPVLGAVGGDLGDLIELRDDAFEVGQGEREDVRGRAGRVSEQYQSAREDFHLMLRGRDTRGASASTSKDD